MKEKTLASSAAEASDREQALGQGGNLRDAGPGAEAPPAGAPNPLGSSGHIPRLEESGAQERAPASGSPGADADKAAAGQ